MGAGQYNYTESPKKDSKWFNSITKAIYFAHLYILFIYEIQHLKCMCVGMLAVPMFITLVCLSSLTLLTSCVTSSGDWITEVDERLPQLLYKTFGYTTHC